MLLKAVILNQLLVGFLICSTAILSVVLGVFGAYCLIDAVLVAMNTRTSDRFRALVPHQSQASGD
jgi:hypothetical protein